MWMTTLPASGGVMGGRRSDWGLADGAPDAQPRRQPGQEGA